MLMRLRQFCSNISVPKESNFSPLPPKNIFLRNIRLINALTTKRTIFKTINTLDVLLG